MISGRHSALRLTVGLVSAALMSLLLVSCAQPSASSSSSTSTTSSSSSEAAQTSSSVDMTSSEAIAAATDDTMIIDLNYNAGTGYEWKWELDPEGIIEIASEGDLDMGEDAEEIAGGPLSHSMIVRAVSPGSATLTCQLVRDWEQGMDPA